MSICGGDYSLNNNIKPCGFFAVIGFARYDTVVRTVFTQNVRSETKLYVLANVCTISCQPQLQYSLTVVFAHIVFVRKIACCSWCNMT
jgi:hypothetical protein